MRIAAAAELLDHHRDHRRHQGEDRHLARFGDLDHVVGDLEALGFEHVEAADGDGR